MWLGRRKFFKTKVLGRLRKVIFRLVCANTVFRKRISNIFTESMLDILSYAESAISPPWLGPEKFLENKGSQVQNVILDWLLQIRYFIREKCYLCIS